MRSRARERERERRGEGKLTARKDSKGQAIEEER